MSLRFSVAAALALGYLTGCAAFRPEGVSVTRAEVESLSRDQQELLRLLQQVSRQVSEQERLLQEIRADSNAQMGELGSRLDRVRYELEGQAERLERWQELVRIRNRSAGQLNPELSPTLFRDLAPDTLVAAPPSPEPVQQNSPQAGTMYTVAYEDFSRGSYEQAITRFREFLGLYPNQHLSDNAQYWLGECYYALDDLDQAVAEYLQVRARFPDGDKVAAATLKTGYAFLRKGNASTARRYLEQVIEEFPDSNEAALALKKLNQMP